MIDTKLLDYPKNDYVKNNYVTIDSFNMDISALNHNDIIQQMLYLMELPP